jgi:autotransporter translocation and assembly factor TamB
LFLLFVVAIASVLTLLHTDFGRNKVREQLEAELADVFVGKVHVGRLEGSVLSSFSLADITIDDAGGQRALSIGTIKLDYSLLALIDQTVKINTLHLDDVEVHARQGEDGTLNLAALLKATDDGPKDEPESDSAPSPWRVLAPTIVVRGVSATYNDGTHSTEIQELLVDASASFEQGIVKAEISKLTATLVPPSQDPERVQAQGMPLALQGSLQQSSEGMSIQSLVASLSEAELAIPALLLNADGETDGAAQLTLPIEVVRQFAPETALLADVQLSLKANRANALQPITIEATGNLGTSPLAASAQLFPEIESATVQLTASGLNASAIWLGTTDSDIDLEFAAEATGLDRQTAHASAVMSISGQVDKAPLGSVKLTAELQDGYAVAEIAPTDEQSWLAAKAKLHVATLEILESELHLYRPKVQSLVRGYSDARGDIRLDAKAHGLLDKLDVEGTLSSKSFSAEGNRVRGLAASWDGTLGEGNYSGKAKLVATSIRTGGTPIGSVRLNVNTAKKDVFNLHLVNRGPKKSHYVNLKSKVALKELGTLVDIDQVRLSVQGLAWNGKGGRITIGKDNELSFRNVSLKSKAGHIYLDGTARVDRGLSNGDLELVADDVDLAGVSKALALEPPLKGTGSMRARIRKAPGKRALGTVHIAFNDVGSGSEIPQTSGVVDLRLVHRDLTLAAKLDTKGVGTVVVEAKARGPRNPLAIPGWQRLREKALVSASVQSSPLAISGVSQLAKDLPTAGTIRIEGDLGAGGSLGSLVVETKGLVHPKTAEAMNSKLRFALDGKRLELTGDVRINERLDSTIRAVGLLPGPLLQPTTFARLTQDNLQEAELHVSKVDLFWWDQIFELGFKPEQSTADVDIVVAQGARKATVTAHATQKGLDAWGKPEIRSSELIATLDADSAKVSMTGALGTKEAARGTIHLDQGWNLIASRDPTALAKTKLNGTIEVLGLPLALLQMVLAPDDTGATDLPQGSLLASATFGGTLANPTAELDAHTVGGVVAGIEFVDLRASAKYSEHHLVANIAGAQKAGGTLHVDTDLRIGPESSTKTTLDANNWDLGFLKHLVPERSIGGLLSANVAITGPLETPAFAGTAHLTKGTVHPGAPLYAMRNLDVELALSPTKLTIRGDGNSGRGDLSIDGVVAMKDLVPSSMRLDLTLAKLPIAAGPLSVFINTETRVRGKTRGSDWRFDVAIGDTTINVPGQRSRVLHPDQLPGDIVFVDSLSATPPTLVAAIAKTPASVVDVYIQAPETIALRGELVRTIVDVDLHARIGNELFLEGTVATRDGWVEIFDRRYDLRRGDLAFDGSTDPSLDIELSHDFSASTLTVSVTGTGSAPALDLRSDPARYDDAELLSFVLGASPDDDVAKEQSAAGRATGVASGYVAGQLQSVVKDVVPIDVLDIDPAAEKLTLGKWLTNKIFLAYRRRFEAQDLENANEAVIEYRFRRRWLLELSYGDQGTGGVDVLWNRRF